MREERGKEGDKNRAGGKEERRGSTGNLHAPHHTYISHLHPHFLMCTRHLTIAPGKEGFITVSNLSCPGVSLQGGRGGRRGR